MATDVRLDAFKGEIVGGGGEAPSSPWGSRLTRQNDSWLSSPTTSPVAPRSRVRRHMGTVAKPSEPLSGLGSVLKVYLDARERCALAHANFAESGGFLRETGLSDMDAGSVLAALDSAKVQRKELSAAVEAVAVAEEALRSLAFNTTNSDGGDGDVDEAPAASEAVNEDTAEENPLATATTRSPSLFSTGSTNEFGMLNLRRPVGDVSWPLDVAAELAVDSTIEKLYLGHCDLNDDDMQLLAAAIRRNTTLVQLALPFNQITDVGAAVLAERGLRHNETLGFLTMAGNAITAHGEASLREHKSDALLQLSTGLPSLKSATPRRRAGGNTLNSTSQFTPRRDCTRPISSGLITGAQATTPPPRQVTVAARAVSRSAGAVTNVGGHGFTRARQSPAPLIAGGARPSKPRPPPLSPGSGAFRSPPPPAVGQFRASLGVGGAAVAMVRKKLSSASSPASSTGSVPD